jgi:hypothetical protein
LQHRMQLTAKQPCKKGPPTALPLPLPSPFQQHHLLLLNVFASGQHRTLTLMQGLLRRAACSGGGGSRWLIAAPAACYSKLLHLLAMACSWRWLLAPSSACSTSCFLACSWSCGLRCASALISSSRCLGSHLIASHLIEYAQFASALISSSRCLASRLIASHLIEYAQFALQICLHVVHKQQPRGTAKVSRVQNPKRCIPSGT